MVCGIPAEGPCVYVCMYMCLCVFPCVCVYVHVSSLVSVFNM